MTKNKKGPEGPHEIDPLSYSPVSIGQKVFLEVFL